MKRCKKYIGVACIDGSCPVARDLYITCDSCWYYKGCEDCAALELRGCPVMILTARIINEIVKVMKQASDQQKK